MNIPWRERDSAEDEDDLQQSQALRLGPYQAAFDAQTASQPSWLNTPALSTPIDASQQSASPFTAQTDAGTQRSSGAFDTRHISRHNGTNSLTNINMRSPQVIDQDMASGAVVNSWKATGIRHLGQSSPGRSPPRRQTFGGLTHLSPHPVGDGVPPNNTFQYAYPSFVAPSTVPPAASMFAGGTSCPTRVAVPVARSVSTPQPRPEDPHKLRGDTIGHIPTLRLQKLAPTIIYQEADVPAAIDRACSIQTETTFTSPSDDNAMIIDDDDDDEVQEITPSDPQQVHNLKIRCERLSQERSQARQDAYTLAGAYLSEKNKADENAKTIATLEQDIEKKYVKKRDHIAALKKASAEVRMEDFNIELNKKAKEIAELQHKKDKELAELQHKKDKEIGQLHHSYNQLQLRQFPSLQEIRDAIPPGGIFLNHLHALFQTRLGDRRMEFEVLVASICRVAARNMWVLK